MFFSISGNLRILLISATYKSPFLSATPLGERRPEAITHFLSAMLSPSVSFTAYTEFAVRFPTKSVPEGDITMARAFSTSAYIGSEERRVGQEFVSTCRSRWSPYHTK